MGGKLRELLQCVSTQYGEICMQLTGTTTTTTNIFFYFLQRALIKKQI